VVHHRYRIQQGFETETRAQTYPCLALRNDLGLSVEFLWAETRAVSTRMVHRFISGFCDEVKESSWIENGRKRGFYVIYGWTWLAHLCKSVRCGVWRYCCACISLLDIYVWPGVIIWVSHVILTITWFAYVISITCSVHYEELRVATKSFWSLCYDWISILAACTANSIYL